MKRVGNLWPRLVRFENLLAAASQAQRGKRFRRAVARFNFRLEPELFRLQEELTAKTYRPGAFRSFQIYEPKVRTINAAPYRDRVVHHALTRVLEPIFERSFIFDSYACRRHKGTHAAVDRCQQFARKYRYVLKADIRKFFPSVDHEILLALVARKIKDRDVLWLTRVLVEHSGEQEPVLDWFPGDDLFTPTERARGLPIGNQTSQFFGNVYLDPLDHFVKEELRIGGYVRYVDDFVLFSDDKAELHFARESIKRFLGGLRLRLHPRKSEIFPVGQGIRFLGYRVFPSHRLLARENVWRFLRRVRRIQRDFTAGHISPADIRARLMSWAGHARHANTFRLRTRLSKAIVFSRGGGR